MLDLNSEKNCFIEAHIDHSRTDYFDLSTLELHNVAWVISGFCVGLACLISFWSVYKHLSNYTRPHYQKHIVRIILMVPIYAIDSFLSFRFYWLAVYFDVVRDCYEAFVIYTFYSLLIEYIGGYNEAKTLCASRESLILSPPLCCIKLRPTRAILRTCKRLTLQYVVIRPVMTICAIVLHSFGRFCPGNLNPRKGYAYITFINFCSVTVAMYALVLFYSLIKNDIAKFKPIPKFLSVKFVIFLCFWQSVAVALFSAIHGLKATTYWSTDNISTGVQNALLCGEMFVAAVWHVFAFTYKDFETGTKTPVFKSAGDTFNPHDIALDVYYSFYPLAKKSNANRELLETATTLNVTVEEDGFDKADYKKDGADYIANSVDDVEMFSENSNTEDAKLLSDSDYNQV